MTRSVFYGFSAYIGSITGPTSCAFWPTDPGSLNWAPALQIPVDLSLNPQAARANKVKPGDIQVDDYVGFALGGATGIGPMFPGGTMNAMCWLESTYWASLAAKGNQPPRLPPNAQFKAYEMCSVLYWDGALANRRFQGLHAQIQAEQGTRALVTIWQPGTSQIPGQNPLGTWWLDLAQLAHPVEPGFTEIAVGPGAAKVGALFLDAAAKGTVVPYDTPKNPHPLGGIVVTGGRRDR